MTSNTTRLNGAVTPMVQTRAMAALQRRRQQSRYAAKLDRAVDDAFGRFAVHYAGWANSLFDRHFLRHHAACTLAAYVAGNLDQQAAAEELVAAWGRQFGDEYRDRRRRRQADLTRAVYVFLSWIVEELNCQERDHLNRQRRFMGLLSATWSKITETLR